MSTPNKNIYSLYARQISAYPSQSADFLSLDVGGAHRLQFRRQNESLRGNVRNFVSPQKWKHNQFGDQRMKRSFNKNESRENVKKQCHSKTAEYDFSSYFHPTMVQDPWQNLMKRYDALRGSKIDAEDSKNDTDDSDTLLNENGD